MLNVLGYWFEITEMIGFMTESNLGSIGLLINLVRRFVIFQGSLDGKVLLKHKAVAWHLWTFVILFK